MCFRNGHVLAFFRLVNSVPFNDYLKTLIMARGVSIRPRVVGEGRAFTTRCCPTTLPSNERDRDATVESCFILLVERGEKVLLGIRRFIIGFVDLVCMSNDSMSLTLPISQGISVYPTSNVRQKFVGIFQARVEVFRPVRFPFAIRTRVVK